MNRQFLLAVLAANVAIGAANASVPTVCYSDAIPIQPTNWGLSVTIPQFNPGPGQVLQSISFELFGEVTGSAAFESLDAAPATVTMNLSAMIQLQRPDNSVLLTVLPLVATTDNVGPFDGVIDFGGTSGATYNNLYANAIDNATSTNPADLALFTGPGTITLPVVATGNSSGSGAGNLLLLFQTSAGASVRVCYEYIPEPATLAMLAFAGLLVRRR